MPRTRNDLSRDDKVSEILDAAAARLRKEGLAGLSVAELARELGLAHSAIYWYFPTKDHLLVGAFEHLVRDLLTRKPKTARDVTEKVMWFVDQMGELYPIRAAMRERAQRSELVADYVAELDERLAAMVGNVLRPYVQAADLEMATRTFIATVQGAFLGGLKPAERRKLLSFALDRLIS